MNLKQQLLSFYKLLMLIFIVVSLLGCSKKEHSNKRNFIDVLKNDLNKELGIEKISIISIRTNNSNEGVYYTTRDTTLIKKIMNEFEIYEDLNWCDKKRDTEHRINHLERYEDLTVTGYDNNGVEKSRLYWFCERNRGNLSKILNLLEKKEVSR